MVKNLIMFIPGEVNIFWFLELHGLVSVVEFQSESKRITMVNNINIEIVLHMALI